VLYRFFKNCVRFASFGVSMIHSKILETLLKNLRYGLHHINNQNREPAMKISRTFFASMLLLLLGTSYLFAQQESGQIHGVIKDAASGEVLAGANVIIKGTSSGAASDLHGEYRISNIAPGSYTLVVRFIGYKGMEMPIEIKPGAVVEQDMALTVQAVEGQEVVITAQARGQIEAINQQLSSNTIMNVVSADKIKELPDQSAAAALSRLPGVSLMNGDQIVIRGIQAKLNAVLINGVQLPSTDMNNRSTSLGFISSNMLSGIEVIKTLTPDMDANTVGGVVNLRLQQAPSGYHLDVMSMGDYNYQNRTHDSYRGWLSVSNRFFDDKLGVFLQGNLDQSDVGNQSGGGVYGGIYGNGDEWHYGQMNQFNFDYQVNDIANNGASLILDYVLPHGKVVFQNSYSHNLTNDIDNQIQLTFSPNTVTYTANRQKYGRDLWMNALQFDYNFDDLKVDFTLSHSSSNKYTRVGYGAPGDNFSFTNSSADPYGTDSSGNVRVFSRPTMTLQDVYGVKILPTNVNNAVLAGWVMARQEFFTEHIYNTSLNVTLPVSFSSDVSAEFKIGGKASRTPRENTTNVEFSGSADPPTYQNVQYFIPGQHLSINNRLTFAMIMNNGFLNDRGKYNLNSDYPFAYALDRDRFDQFMALSMTGWDPPVHHAKSWRDNFDGAEIFSAGYVMGTLNVGPQLTILGGARLEHYNMKYHANFDYVTHEVYGDAVLFDTLNTVDRSDNHIFPNVQVRYKFNDWSDLRVAYSQGISRADYRAIVPSTYFVPGGGALAGNTKLNPAISTNYDLALSIYSNDVGLITVSPFYKRIVDVFYQTNIYYKNLNLYNISFPDSAFFVSKGAQAPGASQQITTYVNNPNPGYLTGLELDWQTTFWYLPKPFNGLVLNVNYTKSYSHMAYHEVDNKDILTLNPVTGRFVDNYVTTDTIYTARLLYQANDVVNTTLGYDYKDFSARLSFNLQGNVITSVASNSYREGDQYTGNIYRWDFTIQQKLPIEGLSISLSGVNIFNSPINTYQNFKKVNSSVPTENLVSTTYTPSLYSLSLRYSL
jgi:TonB-dependent receptor